MAVTRPTNYSTPFANTGVKNTIPTAATGTGKASFVEGFPVITMTPIVSGGIPPEGKDFNGILYSLSSHTVWVNSGGQYRFDSVLATALGGYSVGAVLQNNAGTASYVSAVANNTIDFNATPSSIGVQWLPYSGAAVANITVTTSGGTTNLNATQAAAQFITVSGALTSNAIITFPATRLKTTIINNTTGAFSVTVIASGGGGVPIFQGGVDTVICDGTNIRYEGTSAVTRLPGDSTKAHATTEFVATALAAFGPIAYYGVGRGLVVNGGNVDARTVEYATATIANPYDAATYNTNTNAGPFSVTLPVNPPTGWSITVIDIGNSWGASNLTLTYTGKPIGDDRAPLPENYVLNVSGYGARIYYDGSAYKVRQMRLSDSIAAATPGNITGGGPPALEAITSGDVVTVRGVGAAQGAAWALPPDMVIEGAALRPPSNPVVDFGGGMFGPVATLVNPALTGFLEPAYWDIKLLSNGNYVRCWGWVTATAGGLADVVFDIIDRIGNTVVPPTIGIPNAVANGGFAPLLCALTGGGFVLTGYSGTNASNGLSSYKIFSNAGTAITGNLSFSALQGAPAGILALSNGNFAMVCDLQPTVGLISPHLGVFGPTGAVVTAVTILQPSAANTSASYAGRFSTRLCNLSGGGFGVACFGNLDSSGPYNVAGSRYLTFNAAGVRQGVTTVGAAQATYTADALSVAPLANGGWAAFEVSGTATMTCRFFNSAGVQTNATLTIGGAATASARLLGVAGQLGTGVVVCPYIGGGSATSAILAVANSSGSSGYLASIGTGTAGNKPQIMPYATDRLAYVLGLGGVVKWLAEGGNTVAVTQADTTLAIDEGSANTMRLLPGTFPAGNIPAGKYIIGACSFSVSGGRYTLNFWAFYNSRDAACFIGGATANAAQGTAVSGVWGGGMVNTRYNARSPISINSMTASTDGAAGRWIGNTLYVYAERSARVPGLLLQLNGGGAVGTITLPYAMMLTIGVDTGTATLNGVTIPQGEIARPFAAGQTVTLVAVGTAHIIVTGIEAHV